MVGPASQPGIQSLKIIKICLLISCIFSGLVGFLYLAFDPLVRSVILKQLALSPQSETFFLWEAPPISPHLKIYMFNLTNPEEVFSGEASPHLVEIGPYTYRQKWHKQNITWHTNGTISYRTRKIFTFVAKESCAGCKDTVDNVTTLNVPAISAYYQSRHASWSTTYPLSALIWGLGYKPWVTHTVHDILWGYDEPLFKIAKVFLSEPPPFDKFGLFLVKNSTKDEDLGLYSMFTGEDNPYKLSTLQSFNGRQELDFWNSSECNLVHGSDGASFNPYVSKKDTVWFFNDQLCRALPLVYNNSVIQEGLPGLRFMPREDVFMSAKSYPKENSCFEKDNRESGEGVFDVTTCQFDTPIILSWPHFLGAEDKYKNAVSGLQPDKTKHGFWFDIQDVTGTTLSAKARIQINMKVSQLEMFDQLKYINDTVIPILWFDEGIDGLGTEIVDILKTAVVDPIVWRKYILYFLIGLIISTLIISLVGLGRLLANRASVAKVERLKQQLENKLHVGGQSLAENESAAQLTQPMLGGYLDSSESSRSSTATHSRTSSEGVAPPYVNFNNINNKENSSSLNRAHQGDFSTNQAI